MKHQRTSLAEVAAVRAAVDEEEAKGDVGLLQRCADRMAEVLGVPCDEADAQRFLDAREADFDNVVDQFSADNDRALALRAEIARLIDEVSASKVPLAQNVQKARLVLALWHEIVSLDDKWRNIGAPIIEDRSELDALATKLQRDLVAAVELARKVERDARLAARRNGHQPAVPMDNPRCVRCERRPRKFGDYCGRCADKLGVRPKGRIGTT